MYRKYVTIQNYAPWCVRWPKLGNSWSSVNQHCGWPSLSDQSSLEMHLLPLGFEDASSISLFFRPFSLLLEWRWNFPSVLQGPIGPWFLSLQPPSHPSRPHPILKLHWLLCHLPSSPQLQVTRILDVFCLETSFFPPLSMQVFLFFLQFVTWTSSGLR